MENEVLNITDTKKERDREKTRHMPFITIFPVRPLGFMEMKLCFI